MESVSNNSKFTVLTRGQRSRVIPDVFFSVKNSLIKGFELGNDVLSNFGWCNTIEVGDQFADGFIGGVSDTGING